MSTHNLVKKYFKCELCIFEKDRSKTFSSLFRLQWHVAYHHIDSIEKMAYMQKLAKERRGQA